MNDSDNVYPRLQWTEMMSISAHDREKVESWDGPLRGLAK